MGKRRCSPDGAQRNPGMHSTSCRINCEYQRNSHYMNNRKTRPDFSSIKRCANGMLSPDVYREIHDVAADVHSGTMALAAQDNGLRVATVEKIFGGSRERFGGVEENLEIIRRNFGAFGVQDVIDLHIGSVEEVHADIDVDTGIGMLMLDADGAIDRDLGIFYRYLKPGAPVVIDDYADIGRVFRKKGAECRIDLKHRLTYRLVNHFEDIGALVRRTVTNNTYFGWVPDSPVDPEAFYSESVTRVYRSLVHTDGRIENSLLARAAKVHKRARRLLGRVTGS